MYEQILSGFPGPRAAMTSVAPDESLVRPGSLTVAAVVRQFTRRALPSQ
jgi:hypothetical protein